MFFLYDLERTITLHPSFFGPRVNEYLKNRLMEDVEGTCTGQYYIICVMDAHDISEGRVVPGSAVAEYTVHYRAVVWRPFKGETVDAILIPSDIKWDPNATPPQYTDNGDQVIEKGTHLRIKLIGTRSDVGSMFAIGSVKEDFLGSDLWLIHTGFILMDQQDTLIPQHFRSSYVRPSDKISEGNSPFASHWGIMMERTLH
ncbi:DNA-directed RNA polymerase II subunit [Loxospora ochrophaea]|nr:DNA-directed RNA polymerase II subunit [Loxospora ochrophaea]